MQVMLEIKGNVEIKVNCEVEKLKKNLKEKEMDFEAKK